MYNIGYFKHLFFYTRFIENISQSPINLGEYLGFKNNVISSRHIVITSTNNVILEQELLFAQTNWSNTKYSFVWKSLI